MCTTTRVAVDVDLRPGTPTQRICEGTTASTESMPHEDGESSPLLCEPVAERVSKLMAASRIQWPDLTETGKTLTCESLKTSLQQALESSTLEANLGWCLAARNGAKHVLTKCVCHDNAKKRRNIYAKTLNVLMTKHKPLSDQEIHLVRESARKFVPWGWDKDVPRYRASIPTGNSTLECSQAQGGSWIRQKHHHDDAQLTVLPCGRTVTVFGERRQALLRSLHESLYKSLSRFGWLKQGDFDVSDVSELVEVSHPTETEFISGDYSASTDNIRTEVLKVIVSVMDEKATVLSDEERWGLRRFPLYTLEGRRAQRGSPMGSYLSFPILCIANRMAFDMAVSEDRRLTARDRVARRCKVNGDDIIFRGDRWFASLWKGAANIIGFVVNDDKTGISSVVAELNSTAVIFDRWNPLRVPRIPVKLVCNDIANQADYAEIISTSGVNRELMTDLVKRNFGLVKMASVSGLLKLKGKVPHPLWRTIARQQSVKEAPTGQNYFAMLPVEEPLTFEVGERERLISERIEEVREIVASKARSPGGLETRARRKASARSGKLSPGPLQSLSETELRYVKPKVQDRKETMEFAFLVLSERKRTGLQAPVESVTSFKGTKCLFGSVANEIDRIVRFIRWKKDISPPRQGLTEWLPDDQCLMIYE